MRKSISRKEGRHGKGRILNRTLGLGLILLIYVLFVMNSSLWSDGASFFGLVVLGMLY